MFADGFEHFNRHDAVIGALLVAVVFKDDIGTAVQVRICIFFLTGRQGDALDGIIAAFKRARRKTAPAAADFQHFAAGAVRAVDQAVIFRQLRLTQILFAIFENGRRICHRRVEPQTVKIITEVVMRADIAFAAAQGIDAQQVRQPRQNTRGHAAKNKRVNRLFIGKGEGKQILQVARIPQAFAVIFGKPDIAMHGQIADHAPVAQRQNGGRAGGGAFEYPRFSVRGFDGDMTAFKAVEIAQEAVCCRG